MFFGLDGYSYQLRDFKRYVVFILTTSRDIAFIDMFINRRQQGRQAVGMIKNHKSKKINTDSLPPLPLRWYTMMGSHRNLLSCQYRKCIVRLVEAHLYIT